MLVGLSVRTDVPDIHGQALELLHGIGRLADEQTVVGSADGGKRVAVGGIGKGGNGLSQHVDHPVGGLAAVDEGVERPCGCPHDVGACLVVLGIHQCLA